MLGKVHSIIYTYYNRDLKKIRMKKILLILVISLSIFTTDAQDKNIKKSYDILSELIKNSEGKTKLRYLDSLADLIHYKRQYNYDSIAKLTLALAKTYQNKDLILKYQLNLIGNTLSRTGNVELGDSLYTALEKNYLSQIQKNENLVKFYKFGGLLYNNRHQYEKSNRYYFKALENAKKTDDQSYAGEILMGIGMNYYDMGNLVKSIKYLRQSLPYFEKKHQTNALINVKNIISELYSENGFYQEAYNERNEAIDLAEQKKHYLFMSQLYFNYAEDLHKHDSLPKSIIYYRKALNVIDSSRYKNYYKPIYLAGLAGAYADANNIQQSRKYLKILDKHPNKNMRGYPVAFYKIARLKYAQATGNTDSILSAAKAYYRLMTQTRQMKELSEAEKYLSEAYEKKGMHAPALLFLKKHLKHADSLRNLKKTKILTYYQTLYDTEKKAAQIARQKHKIDKLALENQIKKQWMLFGGSGLIVIFLLLFAWNSVRFANQKQKIQKLFTKRLLQEQENEKRRIAKELHDGIGQNLLLIKNSFKTNPDKTTGYIDQTIEDIRNISRNLHPVQLEKFGLTKAITYLADDISKITGIFITCELDNIDRYFSHDKAVSIYRIIQECFNNIIKHSHATAAKVTIKDLTNQIKIVVQDNGKGFKWQKGMSERSFGLKSLQERVEQIRGRINFDTNTNQGTKITIISYK